MLGVDKGLIATMDEVGRGSGLGEGVDKGGVRGVTGRGVDFMDGCGCPGDSAGTSEGTETIVTVTTGTGSDSMAGLDSKPKPANSPACKTRDSTAHTVNVCWDWEESTSVSVEFIERYFSTIS